MAAKVIRLITFMMILKVKKKKISVELLKMERKKISMELLKMERKNISMELLKLMLPNATHIATITKHPKSFPGLLKVNTYECKSSASQQL
ncbi:hypothetical protein LIER_41694 [Lithospermum erythrorhizon]|uniref:Uncharacterized protein n=1 Tax=Lithospermum erythrorhizon TaxID=34254 RepID=A0AAV3RGN6_LITER